MICGIYCITNKINNKKYIGQSNNIFTRWNEHYNISMNSNRMSTIHKAINKYGIENFIFEILEICDINELNDLEKQYIKLFKQNGHTLYNLTEGGDGCGIYGENNGKSILKDDEVFDIRERYNNHESKYQVYELYKDKITFNGFQCIWIGTSRKTIHMDVYTDENKKYYKNEGIKSKDLFKNSNFTELDVKRIRDLRQNGMCRIEVYEQYKWINENTFNDIWYYNTFKNIKSNLEKKGTKYIRRNQDGINNSMAKYTEEQILDIRRRKYNGEKLKDVYKIYQLSSISSFRKIWNYQSYINIGREYETN